MIAALNNRLVVRKAQRGVGLLEVLIALVVFALGVVGMAGLQLRTMSVTMDSTQRSYVVAKSQDIADRIRSNGIPVSKYLGDYSDEDDFCDTTPAAQCADNTASNAATCDDDQMVAFDLHDAFCVGGGSYDSKVAEWQVVISCEAPDATTGVMTTTTACNELGARVTVNTSWFARSGDNDQTAASQRDSMTLRFVP